MQGIPIIVSRINRQGNKETYTFQETFQEHFLARNTYGKKEFKTVDPSLQPCLQQPNKRIRVRRIQSSGGKKRLPKDFFSRQNNKSSRKYAQRAETITQQVDESANQNEESANCSDSLETPKFAEKFKIATPIKITKLKSSATNAVIDNTISNANIKNHCTNKITLSNNGKNAINFFENTFSANQLKAPKWTCRPFQIPMLKKNGEKQNSKGVKTLKTSKQTQNKKFSLIKDRASRFKCLQSVRNDL